MTSFIKPVLSNSIDARVIMCVSNEYTGEEIAKRCSRIRELEGGHMISTMEQYFKLIDEISDVTYENYSIYPEGDFILMFAN